MITTPSPTQWRVSRCEYDRLGELGFFTSKRVQLINGQVIQMAPMGSPHATSVSLSVKFANGIAGKSNHVRCQLPLSVDEWSEPEPDVAIVVGDERQYSSGHPTTAELVIEVADSSLELDRDVKSVLYATANVKEYWVVDVNKRCVEVFREPDKTAGVYQSRRMFAKGEKLSAIGRTDIEIAVSELLP
jgi:Uma2 family endonuclease